MTYGLGLKGQRVSVVTMSLMACRQLRYISMSPPYIARQVLSPLASLSAVSRVLSESAAVLTM